MDGRTDGRADISVNEVLTRGISTNEDGGGRQLRLAVTSSPAALSPSPWVPTGLPPGISELPLPSTVSIRFGDKAQGQAVPAPRAPAAVAQRQHSAALTAPERSDAGWQQLR